MSTVKGRREEQLLALETALRRSSAQGVLFSQAVAERLGIASSDLECLDILILRGVATAGELADATGLTTGAITGVVDRLEAAGFARRARDPRDRRKVLVRPLPAVWRRIAPLYESLQRAMVALWSEYSDADLALLADFTTRSHEVMVHETARLRALAPPRSGGRRAGGVDRTAPRR